MSLVPSLTFVSMTGPRLDNVSAKAMRAHTTKANFARRRRRLVQEYTDKREGAPRLEPLQVDEDDQTTDHDQAAHTQTPAFGRPGKLNRNDAFFINKCA